MTLSEEEIERYARHIVLVRIFPGFQHTVDGRCAARGIDDPARQAGLLIVQFVDHRGDRHGLPFVLGADPVCDAAQPVEPETRAKPDPHGVECRIYLPRGNPVYGTAVAALLFSSSVLEF